MREALEESLRGVSGLQQELLLLVALFWVWPLAEDEQAKATPWELHGGMVTAGVLVLRNWLELVKTQVSLVGTNDGEYALEAPHEPLALEVHNVRRDCLQVVVDHDELAIFMQPRQECSDDLLHLAVIQLREEPGSEDVVVGVVDVVASPHVLGLDHELVVLPAEMFHVDPEVIGQDLIL